MPARRADRAARRAEQTAAELKRSRLWAFGAMTALPAAARLPRNTSGRKAAQMQPRPLRSLDTVATPGCISTGPPVRWRQPGVYRPVLGVPGATENSTETIRWKWWLASTIRDQSARNAIQCTRNDRKGRRAHWGIARSKASEHKRAEGAE